MSLLKKHDCNNFDYVQDEDPTFYSIKTPLISSHNFQKYLHLQQQQQPRSSISFTDNRRDSEGYILNDSSYTSFQKVDQLDHSRNLQILQQKLTQQLLCLKEQKLTLMQQQNEIIQNRYRIEREIHKLKKRLDNSNVRIQGNDHYGDNSGHQNKVKMQVGDDIKTDYSMLSEYQCQMMQKILNLKQANNELQLQLSKSETKRKQTAELNPEYYMSKLEAKKQRLIHSLLSSTPQKDLQKRLYMLWESNKDLQTQINKYIEKRTQGRRKLEQLRQRVSIDEQNKKVVLEEVIGIKWQVKCLKMENQQLRKACTFFKF